MNALLHFAASVPACVKCGEDAEQDCLYCADCADPDRALREAFEWAATYGTSDGAERLRQWALEVYS